MATGKREQKDIQEILKQTKIIPINIRDEMSKSFISYAMAVNVSRAIPDVRDGLKPVHRRILYAMHDLNNTHDKPYKKCARIVGEVLGKYHPHGDSAVYDALVRMAQDFSARATLIDGHGNFGSVDGDPPAAQRYTEARLSKIASEMLKDIEKETVDFYPNFDDTLLQPVVLPAKFPNLLVNGSEGIAVGMATNIPPHNLGEVIDAVIALMEDETLETLDLMQYLPAPDYPTGAIVLNRSAVKKAYMTGRGGVTIRARVDIEEENGRQRLVVKELPYQVNKANLIKNIADLVKDKKLEGISDIKEESDRLGMRVVIEIKKDHNAQVVLNNLYKQTALQVSNGICLLALVEGKPKICTLKELLQYYIKHQIDVIERRTRFNLRKAEEREHIVRGLVIALSNIDRVIEIIKSSAERNQAMTNLMQEFELTEKQANAILDMRLARLTSLEVHKLHEELAELEGQIKEYKEIIANPDRVKQIIKDELTQIKTQFADERKSEISDEDLDICDADLIDREDVVVTMTYQGYIKRIPVCEYRSQGRGGVGVKAHTTKDEDFLATLFVSNTHDDLLFFSNKGKAYVKKVFEIPEASRTAKGRAMVNVLPLDEGEKITAFLPIQEYGKGYIVMATRNGLIRKSDLKDFESVRSNGKIAITLQDDDELIGVELTIGNDDIMVASSAGKCIRFSEKEVRRTGRGSQGVKSMSLKKGEYVVDMAVVKDGKEVITISENGYGKRTAVEEFRPQGRGGMGIKAGNFNEKTGKLVNMKLVGDDEDIIIIADNGTMIRIRASQVSSIGRATQGVIIMRLKDDSKVVAMALAPQEEDTEYDEV
ncbi:MAG: DNA gyrase subunit A [Bacillota bacterium]|jgi:DNA gyrase subunit A|nr:DNA gyrase subunit A [Bacillota bacterium]HHU43769.1 DNA gyrase subunit A [Clostridiales bacterium]